MAPLKHVYLMGGFAEDALLHQRVTRERSDLDLLVERGAWAALRAELASIGVDGFEPQVSGPAGEPLALRSRARDPEVEVWLATREIDGYSIILPGDAASHFRLRLPPDTFVHPATAVEGVTVQTVSPLALCRFRAASARTRGNAEKRAEDHRVLARLAALLPGLVEAELVPEIEGL